MTFVEACQNSELKAARNAKGEVVTQFNHMEAYQETTIGRLNPWHFRKFQGPLDGDDWEPVHKGEKPGEIT